MAPNTEGVRDHTYPPRRREVVIRQTARRCEVVSLLREGFSMREVARRLGVSPGTVCADWKAVLAELHEDTRQLERERHDLFRRAAVLLERAAEIDLVLRRRHGEPNVPE